MSVADERNLAIDAVLTKVRDIEPGMSVINKVETV